MSYLEQVNLKRQKVDQSLPWAECRRNGQLVFSGYRVWVWEDIKVLEVDGDDGYKQCE